MVNFRLKITKLTRFQKYLKNLGHFVFKSDNFERQIKNILSNLNIEISESEKMSFYEVSDFTKENTFTDLAEGPAVDKVNISKIAILTQNLTITWSK